MATESNIFARFGGDLDEQLAMVVQMMRDISRHTDPQAMVHEYSSRMQELMPMGRGVSLSRRGLEPPQYRITRASIYDSRINPWKEAHKLPVYDRGLFGKLIYADEPTIIDDLRVDPDDPCASFFEGQRSLAAVPVYDGGVALNMIVFMRSEAGGFPKQVVPQMVHMANLFGRATKNLVLSEQLKRANVAMDAQMRIVADIQRSLLPATLPYLPTMDLAAYYNTSDHAGGDYYDFFPLDNGRWGILVADVCGHGTPAAVLMAVTHCLAHTRPDHVVTPDEVLDYVNRQLAERYTTDGGTFVTAFFGVYDPVSRVLRYSNAGHNPPRVKRCADGTTHSIDAARSIPLGIIADTTYHHDDFQFMQGDQVLFYTDGIVEARNADGRMFGTSRLDGALANCDTTARGLIDDVLRSLAEFTAGLQPDDDQTLLAAKIR